jgi:archaellum component FlaC
MHRLTLDQKIENYEELLESKKLKLNRLEEEIKNITLKVEKLRLSRDKFNETSDSSSLTFETSNFFQNS